MELIESYRDIETILENIDRNKYTVPENWNYQVARELFITPDIQDPQEVDVSWKIPQKKNMHIYMTFTFSLNGLNPMRRALSSFFAAIANSARIVCVRVPKRFSNRKIHKHSVV